MGKDIIFAEDARNKILSGVTKLAKTVAVTMGPRGKNVIIGKSVGAPTITKDGVSVAREVVLQDPIEELGCQLVKEAAGRTADVAGDGTTTATVLTHEILSRGMELMATGYSPLDFRDGIDWALEAILSEINKIALTVDSPETLRDIAVISANNDKDLGGVIAEAYSLVGNGGMVTAEAAPGVPNSVRLVEGIELASGYLHHGFLEKGQSKIVLENCHILICDREITHISDNTALFNELSTQNKSLLIICKDLKKEALNIFLKNLQIGRIKVAAIKIPTFGKRNEEWLEDLSNLVGTTVISEDRNKPLSKITLVDLGFAGKIEVSKYDTAIIEPRRNEALIANRISTYKQDLLKLIGDFDKKDIKDRMSFLGSKAAIITVGYNTELELREKGDRVDDATSAVKAALEGGYVPGGGFALLRAVSNINILNAPEELRPAIQILLDSCKRPAQQILDNGRENSNEIIEHVLSDKGVFFGYNLATRKYGDLIEMGIIDPKKVTITALTNATSIAYLLLTTDAVIADMPNSPSGWQPPAGYRLPSDNNLNHKY